MKMRPAAPRHSVVPALLVCLLCSCTKNPPSMILSLALSPGMERTMRFVTEQRTGRLEGTSVRPDNSSVSFTYRFRVTSIDAARTAKLECAVQEAHVTPGSAAADSYLKGLTRQKLMMVIDKDGHVLSLKGDTPGFAPGGPVTPGSVCPTMPAQGDLRGFFGALTGRKVSVGDTWTSDLAQSGSQGLQGTLTWTLAAVAGTTARLQYSGRLEQREISLQRLPPGKRAFMHGEMSGYILLELDTGWPAQGRSVMNAEVSMRDAGAQELAATRLVSLSLITRFEPVQ